MTASGRFRNLALLIIGTTGCIGLVGCSRTNDAKSSSSPSSQVAVVEPSRNTTPANNDPSFVPFNQAVRLEAPDGENRPPDVTVTGKVVGKLFEQIAGKGGLWEQVSFISAEGKPLKYFALVKTDAGDMKIDLFQDAAPNHVRSFICLARAGYFDGLPFHQSIRREGKDNFRYLESGCPKGAGELGYGSVGYWLKPEISKTLTHEEGAVGAWHPEELERAACRFYITLAKTPAYDGNYTIFGKVVHGLDVANTINKRPIQDEEYKGPPQEPYRIRQVLIQSTE